MVVLIKKLSNFHHKSQKPKLESITLQSFNSTISENLFKLFSDNKNELNYSSFSLSLYIPCFKFLQGNNRAFAKLVKDLDYPITKWDGKLAEDYFSHTLNMLDALNSINSLVSQVGFSRLSLSHAISCHTSSRVENLKPIVPKKIKALNFKEMVSIGSLDCGKGRVIHEAMMKMRSVDMLILKVLLCGLYGDGNEEISKLNWNEFEGFNMGFVQEFVIVKEIKEVNEIVKEIEENESNKSEKTEELKNKLNELEELTEVVGKEVNCLFSEVLARRNELINCFRLPKCT